MLFAPRIARRFVDVRMEGEAWKALPEAELERLTLEIQDRLADLVASAAEDVKLMFPEAALVVEVE